MVVKVYGKCNGSDISFTPASPQLGNERPDCRIWTVVVPKAVAGTYVLELFAVDDAGNTTYFATVKYFAEYTAGQLRFRWEILEIGTNWNLDDVRSVLGIAPR